MINGLRAKGRSIPAKVAKSLHRVAAPRPRVAKSLREDAGSRDGPDLSGEGPAMVLRAAATELDDFFAEGDFRLSAGRPSSFFRRNHS